MTTEEIQAALAVEFECSDLDRKLSVREYLQELLHALFDEEDGFSGKRPFGNSGWQYDVVKPLIAGGFLAGTLDEDGCVDEFDKDTFLALAHELIAAL